MNIRLPFALVGWPTTRAAVLAGLLSCACGTALAASIHDLAADWSDAGSPNQGWAYNNSLGNGGGPLGANIPNWNPGDFGTGQPGYPGNIAASPPTGWAKLIQNPNSYDILPGEVVTHGPTSVLWQADTAEAGTYNVDINLWRIRGPDPNAFPWEVWINNDATLQVSGTVSNSNSTHAAPLVIPTFQVTLNNGDYVRLNMPSTFQDFIGVNMTLTPVPEPASMLLGSMGAVALVGIVWRRRKIARHRAG